MYHPPQVDWGEVKPGDLIGGAGDSYFIVATEFHEEEEYNLWYIRVLALITRTGSGAVEMSEWTTLVDEPFDDRVVLIRRD